MAALALLALIAAAAVPDWLPPIDQCRGDSSFDRFRSELSRIVERHDTARIIALLDEDVMVSFGMDGGGKAAFFRAWHLDNPRQSRLWSELRTMLRLGCTAEDGTWLMPSLSEQLGADSDSIETYVAIVPGAALRSAPRDGAPVVTRLHWDVLRLTQALPDERWLKVSLRDGRHGYVRQEQVRNPLDYRMVVQRKSGALRITAFVAGD